jgi:hypothetical protein
MTGNAGKRTADSRGARTSGEGSKTSTPQNKETPKTEASASVDDTNDDDTRIVEPELLSGAYLTCSVAVSAAKPAQPGETYFGCVAFDANKNRLDLSQAKVSFILKDLQGNVLSAPVVDLPDTDQDVVWQVPHAVYAAGLSPVAEVAGHDTPAATLPRKCFSKNIIGGQVTYEEAQCQAPT